MKPYDMAPIFDVMDKAMADLTRMTMTPDVELVRTKLIPCIAPPFKLKKVSKKKYGYIVIINFPGIYVEPPERWIVKWVNFETHDICLYISFTDFEFYYAPEEAGITI